MSTHLTTPRVTSTAPPGAPTDSSPGPELARVTVVAPDRRLDIAVPERARVAELLPGLLARAGDTLADDGEKHGGWRLRTETGTPLDADRSLAEQEIRDGHRLYLVPGADDWPEVDYDDVVEAIAQGARARLPDWTPGTTRTAALAMAAVTLAAGLLLTLAAPVPYLVAGAALAATGTVLGLGGTVLARALGDSRGGVVVAAAGVAFAVVAASFASSPQDTPLLQVDAVDLLLASTTLLIGSLLAHVGVAAATRIWSAGAVAGAAGLIMSVLGVLAVPRAGAAAVVVAVLTGLLAVFPLLAMRLGRIPVPALPETPDELLADRPRPDPAMVRSAVFRADELLTGFLAGTAVATAACLVVLFQRGGVIAPVLAIVVASTFALRSGLFPTVRHKVPLLAVGGVGGLALLAALPAWTAGAPGVALALGVVLLVVVAALRVAARAGRSRPSPYFARAAELVEMLLVVSVLPLAGSVVGAYAFARGLAG
ncbi:MAG: type VII secretion integral membrane protein EccD [Kineosporiaceae bacterium]